MRNTYPTINIKNKVITSLSSPYIIAEIGVNHEGSIDTAKVQIDMIAKAGAHAAKFQTYKAEKLASKHSPYYWDLNEENSKSQYELFKKHDSFEKEHYIELFEYCNKKSIDFISTPFDHDAVDFLEPLMPFFKIASADITNLPLLRRIARYKKPVIMSTGASTFDEIKLALDELKNNGANEVALLHCVLNYPTKYENAGLSMITKLKNEYPEHIIGYSDHTYPEKDMLTVITAINLGAVIIEKHFTHDKNLKGNDHYHSMDYTDLTNLINNVKRIDLIKREIDIKQRSEEFSARKNARRSIVLSESIKKGMIIQEHHLICKRPALGISPVEWDRVIGKKTIKDLNSDHILSWEDLN